MTSFNRGLAAEWIKLRSLRSSAWTLGAMVIASIGLAVLISVANAHSYSGFSAADKATWDPTNTSLAGTVFGQLAIAVFGVLAITGEFASGTIRSSIAATPRRTRLLAAKAVVYGGVALVIGELISLASFFISQPLIAQHAPHATFGEPGVARAVLFAGVYLALICLISLGIATLLRHTAGAITAVVALVLVIPPITSTLPSSFQHAFAKFLPPLLGGNSMGAVVREPHSFGPFVAAAVLCSYAGVTLLVAGWSLARRDV
jgi:ABC-2 type transport system permease protein